MFQGAIFVLKNISENSDVGDSKNAYVGDSKKLGICSCLGILCTLKQHNRECQNLLNAVFGGYLLQKKSMLYWYIF